MSGLSSVGRLSRWSEPDGRVVVAAFRSSGLGLAAFSRSQGLNADRVRYWVGRLRGHVLSSRGSSGEVHFASAVVTSSLRVESVVSVELGDAALVRVPELSAASAQWVAALLRALSVGEPP